MTNHDPIAYTFEADYHCPPCTFARFGTDENGSVPENAEDSEGNQVGAVAPWDEWWEPTSPADVLVCSDCQEELARRVDADAVEALGRGAGHAAATWAFDGNTDTATYARVLQGYEDGDPEILDMAPAPLSGEWAGESMRELSSQFGIPLDDPEVADLFEAGFSDGYWAEIVRACQEQVR